MRAGDETGHQHLAELTIQAPLTLTASSTLQVQVVVTAPTAPNTDTASVTAATVPTALAAAGDRREVKLFARPEQHLDRARNRVLTLRRDDQTPVTANEWPPAGASPTPRPPSAT